MFDIYKARRVQKRLVELDRDAELGLAVDIQIAHYRAEEEKLPRCPWCNSTEVDAEYVHNGVGLEQVDAAMCASCGAVQMNSYSDNTTASEEEQRLGWWRGPPRPEPPLKTKVDWLGLMTDPSRR
jgi:hypothetical protein